MLYSTSFQFIIHHHQIFRRYMINASRLLLKCDGPHTETRFRVSAKRTSPFKSAGASVQSNTGSRAVRIGGSNAGYTMFRSSVKSTGYPRHSPVSPSFPLLCVTVCHHISTGLYEWLTTSLGKVQSKTELNSLHESAIWIPEIRISSFKYEMNFRTLW